MEAEDVDQLIFYVLRGPGASHRLRTDISWESREPVLVHPNWLDELERWSKSEVFRVLSDLEYYY